ncbi:MAG: HNH endonuclease [Bacteroidota bacterium]
MASYTTFANKIKTYRRKKGDTDPDPIIGCIVLTEPFFFPREEWIEAPEDWSNSIVQGKVYDTASPIGKRIWAQVQERIARLPMSASAIQERQIVSEGTPAYGAEFLMRARLGQSSFRVAVIEAHHRRCALTGEKTLPVLTAAHIKPYAEEGPHQVSNGLLLRSDLHLLFDRGLITISPEYAIEVSGRIRELYENGRIYYALHGKEIALPDLVQERPARRFLEWHNQEVYKG